MEFSCEHWFLQHPLRLYKDIEKKENGSKREHAK